ncbi:MAG TPA: hypothetical protein VNN79_14510 [Actinomycetota bacterium]|nr:hypothetical protein [Actinomycetota bacterium]
MSELPTEDEFRGCIGDEFAVIDGEDGTTVVLDEVTSLGDRGEDAPPEVRRRPFSLMFRGDPGLDQRTHRLRHDRLGDLDVFLVPIQPDARGSLYEAVFG